LIGKLRNALESVTDWNSETTKPPCGISPSRIISNWRGRQPLRVALTGGTTSPGIFDVLAGAGRDQCLARLADQAAG